MLEGNSLLDLALHLTNIVRLFGLGTFLTKPRIEDLKPPQGQRSASRFSAFEQLLPSQRPGSTS